MQTISEMVALMTEERTASPARLRAMNRQVIARVVEDGSDDDEAYELARQVRRAERAAARS